MRILVTGGAGYIGSITTRLLHEAGHDVIVLDTLEKGHREAVEVELVVGDVGDEAVLDRVLPGCDAVMHLAGYIEVAESQERPGRYFENNAAKPLALLEAMVRHSVSALVFSSTAAVYGEPESVPITEDAATRPINAYGASKLAFEDEIKWFEFAHELRAVRLRYFNVAGAWPDGSMGEAHDPETHIIPRILRSILEGNREFTVFGDDYPTPDGTCVRDYIHVVDLARAHQLALEGLDAGQPGGVFNLGNGRGFSNLEVVDACATVTGKQVKTIIGHRRPGDPAVLVASHEAAEEVLGWRSSRGRLEEIVGDAWGWHSGHPKGYGE